MNADELRKAFEKLPPLTLTNIWGQHQLSLRQRMAKGDDPARMLRWKPIKSTISTRCDGYVGEEFKILLADEARDWRPIIEEPGFGSPPHLCEGAEWTSGGMVHQAHHLKMLLDRVDIDIAALGSIFEVGAGCAQLCLIIERMGFKGDYYILDLPEFCLLQQYYLSNVGAATQPIYANPERCDLAIAMHSLAEMPAEQRTPFEDVEAGAYLIGYKSAYGGFDNATYFERFIAERPRLRWWNWQPWAHLGKAHWDLIGG